MIVDITGAFIASPYQVGVVVRDLDVGIAHYTRLFGLERWKRQDTDYTARYRQWEGRIANRNAFAPWGSIHLELIEPGIGLGNAREWLEARGEGIFHLGFAADLDCFPNDVEVAFAVTSRTLPDGRPAIVHLDTVGTLGYFTELTWRPIAEKLDAWVRSS